MKTFHDTPAVVFAAGAVGGLEVHFFPGILAYISDVEVAGLAVEGETPGVAQTVGPDFIQKLIVADKWVVARDGVWRAGGSRDFDAEEFAKQCLALLPVVLGIGSRCRHRRSRPKGSRWGRI